MTYYNLDRSYDNKKYSMNTRQIFLLIIFHILLIYSTSYSQNAELADNYSHQAYSLYQQGRYFEAAQMYEKSAEAEKLSLKPRPAKLAVELGWAGYLYQQIGQYDKAIKNNEEALANFRKQGQESSVATLLNNIGGIYDAWGQYDRAVKYYNEALEIIQNLGWEDMIAMSLNNIGMVYLALGQYNEAIRSFVEAVEIIEKLRKTALGNVRRDYLASQIHTYQFLTSAYLRNGDFSSAFHTIEFSRAKVLSEQLASTQSMMSISSVEQIQNEIQDDIAILVYGNVSWENKIIIIITKEMIHGIEISDNEFITSAMEQYEYSIQTMLRDQRGIQKIKRIKKELQVDAVKEMDDFEDVINYYRSLLTNPSNTNNEKAGMLGGMLHDFLIKPAAGYIGDKTRLIIVPDGVLGFIPFETLLDEKGQYLVETHEIKYTQSMGILELLKKRSYEKKRKSLLAFGGAVYDEVNFEVDMVENENQLAYLEKDVYSAFIDKRSIRSSYAALGVSNWSNLPGTLSEVRAIKKTVNGAEILTGDEVTENQVKALSTSGKLSQYRVLHFAAHSLVVPAFPELSALVLSQFERERGGEDGYLRMEEIAALDIEADFVNLSACETGLGKIYGGEGIVGLTQSF